MQINKDLCDKVVHWLGSYLEESGLSNFIIGVSGGVDSALASTLCAETGRPIIVLNIPIISKQSNTDLSTKHCNWLSDNYDNVTVHNIDLTKAYEAFKGVVLEHTDNNDLAFANTKSRMRMMLLYYFATSSNGLVVGTGNKVEDFGVGFYTKYGDGGVDISPIADMSKTQVRQCASLLGITDEILNAPPTDGLWEDSRTDEEQIGASYEELEWAMEYVDEGKNEPLSTRQEEVVRIFLGYRNKNSHKMSPIPIFLLESA